MGFCCASRRLSSPIDLYNALFETTGIDEALTDYGLLVVRGVLAGKQYEDLFGHNREAISGERMAQGRDMAAEWGVEILSFELSDCRPSDETARLIQTSAQASFKLDALTAAAQARRSDSGGADRRPNLVLVRIATCG